MGNNSYTGVNPPSTDPQALDTKVKATLLRWGNFDYATNQTHWDPGEIPAGVAVPTTQVLPASLYYSSKPSWWPTDVAWPPIGPDVSGYINKIPAQVCFENHNLASGGTFNASACYSSTPSDLTPPANPTGLTVY